MKNKIVNLFHLNGIKLKLNMWLVNNAYKKWTDKNFQKKRQLLNALGHNIEEGTKIIGPITISSSVSTVNIGKDCFIGTGFTVHGNGTVTIGNNCDIAPDVAFLTGGHLIGDEQRRAGKGETYTITVGNGVWIGARSTILMNTNISDSCVVAACSCVTKSTEKNTLIGGVPAKLIKNLESTDIS